MEDEKKFKEEEQIKENNNEQREMTQQELDEIVGGYIPNQPRTQETPQHMPGMSCPNCGNFIPASIEQVLFSRVLFCPTCGLKINIDKRKADKALEILAKVDEAMRRA